MSTQVEGAADFGCCRFCPTGKGAHKLKDDAQNCVFYLCYKHLSEYKVDQDDIQSNIDTRAEIAARTAAAENEAASSLVEKVEVQ